MPATATIRVGEKLTLHAAATVGSRPSGEAFEFESSDAAVAIDNGDLADRVIIRGVAVGEATITAIIGGKSASVVVTVIAADTVTDVTLTP